jgi:hypothetical protein
MMRKYTRFFASLLLICSAAFLFAADGQQTPAKDALQVTPQAAVEDDSGLYYPAHVGDTLYLNAWKKTAPEKEVFVKAEVIRTEIKADGEFYYFYGPQVDVHYLIGVDKDGITMRVIKYPFPLFDLSVEVTLKPKMTIILFPLKVGEKWHYDGKAEAIILFIPFTRNIKADFEVVERVTMKTPAGDIDTYHIKVLLDEGDGKGVKDENYWYGRDIGYSVADTNGHKAELAGYRIYDEKTGKWNEKLPEDAEKYK